MNLFNCIIIDDDYGSISVVEKYLNQLNEFELIGKFTDSIKAFSEITKLNPDLIFLDIEMPNLSGIELIKLISSKQNIILITASNKYALEGFELDVIDYLMKPLSFDRFLKAINKFKNNHINDIERQKSIYVTENYKTTKIDIDTIEYIESAKEYVIIYTDDRVIKTKQRIKHLEEQLKPFAFVRIHRSFIVSVEKIIAYTKSIIELKNKTLPIGRNYKNKINLKIVIK